MPLEAHELSAETVLHLSDLDEIRAALERVVPDLEWRDERHAKATVDGRLLEFRLPRREVDTLSLRCSLRADHTDLVQGFCDTLGWLAFDEQPMCYQPHRPPMHC
ncbi:MAG TPA: hypothetical protein VJV78_25670 [Polyangiales bacterium]|nr:hypothetical protein [Polyangiales bacterium]